MTDAHLEHYFKGGMFSGIYSPIRMDISKASQKLIGHRLTFYQNMEPYPIWDIAQWEGQYRFNSDQIDGWLPEEDISGLTPIPHFLSYPEPHQWYVYRFTFVSQASVWENLGRGYSAPVTLHRAYTAKRDVHKRLFAQTTPPEKIELAYFNAGSLSEFKTIEQ